jgi:hypothetical protein
MQFHGKVLRDDKVVLDDVTGELDVTGSSGGGFSSWSGRLNAPVRSLLPRLVYRLILDDGRSGNFFATSFSPQGFIGFKGTGSLQ